MVYDYDNHWFFRSIRNIRYIAFTGEDEGKKLTIDITNQRFTRLIALNKVVAKNGASAYWRCLCDCGAFTEVGSYRLRTGKVKSCGCYRRDNPSNYKHGESSDTKGAYKSWKEMRSRCTNSKNKRWHRYGARGIEICARWDKYTNFLKDMGERPYGRTLDRIDNNGNYEPNNCRWATPTEQVRNSTAVKIDMNIANQIRLDFKGGLTRNDLVFKYKLAKSTICRIINNKLWKP